MIYIPLILSLYVKCSQTSRVYQASRISEMFAKISLIRNWSWWSCLRKRIYALMVIYYIKPASQMQTFHLRQVNTAAWLLYSLCPKVCDNFINETTYDFLISSPSASLQLKPARAMPTAGYNIYVLNEHWRPNGEKWISSIEPYNRRLNGVINTSHKLLGSEETIQRQRQYHKYPKTDTTKRLADTNMVTACHARQVNIDPSNDHPPQTNLRHF